MADTRKKAAALRYDTKKESAPRVVAKGKGKIAEQILKVAKDHKVPIKDDPQLVEVLSTLDLHQEIPPELYRAVAEILAFVYRMTKKVQ
ncbi:MAG: flagellar biosynthesis protein FlhB [Nitrospirae bacterium GWC2_46_6]|nr:MAG: flagellar biosynthesis protein FlhB [Nitrospirae bacterium GWC2_46_6]OGW26007.1 MAG: flagellar biosynthesis protein FlhB [Nitrospirae bacterium GWB2_47_37]HAK88297.1 flagellar biosynthesis protein FlhB [Nitrospiraceae bacterium]HCL81820.1 flagellar biosynthesis protein FlhB [Nitrospiraceae bacterium]